MQNLDAPAPQDRRRGHQTPIYFLLFLGLLLLRCWPRLASPQVWAEDGVVVLAGFLGDGWATFFQPVNGYWQLVGKAISAVALSISIYQYPAISIVASCLFAAAVGVAVAVAPTTLRGKLACALAVFLVPTDAEVFGLPLYAFWWAGILLLLVALWEHARRDIGWRAGFLLIGGLSSPLILLIVPVLYLRAWKSAVIADRWLAVLATAIALLQLAFMATSGSVAATPPVASLSWLVPKFFGGMLIGNLTNDSIAAWVLGLALAGGIVAWMRCDESYRARWVLVYLALGAMLMSATRVDLALLNTRDAGPRYFFYPFILLSWMLVQSWYAGRATPYRIVPLAAALLAMANMVPVLTRYHVDLQWQAHVRSCRLFADYNIPVEVDGKEQWPGWDIALKGSDCDAALRRDLLAASRQWQRLPTFAYNVQRGDWTRRDAGPALIATTVGGGDSSGTAREGYRVIGSFGAGTPTTGVMRLRMNRGDSVLYRSGPDKTAQAIGIEGREGEFIDTVPSTGGWIRLTFANRNLPDEFIVEIRDDGEGDAQWSAVALPREAEG
jgi:hypothetical protein